jgi:hypothetical protein
MPNLEFKYLMDSNRYSLEGALGKVLVKFESADQPEGPMSFTA